MTELLWTDLAKYDFSDLALTSRLKDKSLLGLFMFTFKYMNSSRRSFSIIMVMPEPVLVAT